jgi:hypothetical protein
VKKTVRVQPMRHHRHEGVLVQTPYSAEFVTALKAMVPYTDRIFNEHRHGWWVSQRYADVATHLAHQHFGGAEITDANGDKVVVTAAGERCKQSELFR